MKVSVIIPLYNKADYIKTTIESVLAQSYKDFEVIIIDDGSTDNSQRIVSSISDSRIKLLHQENAGVSVARNMGIKAAQGEFIAFLDADDEWVVTKLEKQVKVLESFPKLMWCSCNFNLIHKGRQIRKHNFPRSWFKEKNVISNAFLPLVKGFSFWTGTLIIRKRCFEKIDLFREDFHRSEDLELVSRLAQQFPEVGYIDEELANYVILENNSLTSDKTQFESPEVVCKLPKLLLQRANECDTRTQKYLNLYVKKLIEIRMFSALVNGYSKCVRRCYWYCNAGFSVRSWIYIFASLFPQKLLITFRRVVLSIKMWKCK